MSNEFKSKYLRQLPSVGKLIENPELSGLSPHSLVIQSIREIIDIRKSLILSAKDEMEIANIDLSPERIITEVKAIILNKSRMGNRYAINATGDVLNEKLGRSPLNDFAKNAVINVIKRYSICSDRELNELLSYITGAEASLVVNNGIAGLILALNTFCNGKEVVVSRGELFDDEGRLPELIELSSSKLISVGTTNKTHLEDYKKAINANTGAILKVNRDNYRIVGFTEQVELSDLIALMRKYELLVINYMENGCLIDLTQFCFSNESYVPLSIKNGADIVCFSGNRLFGSSQTGMIVGKEKYILPMSQNPLYNALKPDKIAITALESTLRTYIDTDKIVENNVPLQLLNRSYTEISSMAEILIGKIKDIIEVKTKDSYSYIESISLNKLQTRLVLIKPTKISSEEFAQRLIMRDIPIFVICENDHIVIDLRTVWIDEIDEIANAIYEIYHNVK
jgi:L-seryl-tRNA(Ser) seleniumtransferase